jgi:hypothetical protein
MAKSDLLKQAIADANAVKETALANAKIALQEAFAPRLERMLATKLTNEIEGEEEEIDAAADTMGVDADADMGADMGAEGGEEDFTWTDDSLSATVGGQDYDFQVGMAGGDEEDLGGEELPGEEAPISDEDANAEYNEGYGHDDEDLELESIIRELEAGMPEEMEEEEDDLMPEGMHHDDDKELEEGEDEELDESIDEIIEAILREDDMDAEEEVGVPAGTDGEVETMKEELEEAYRTVKKLTSIINEVNLLNAKLLYTNKLFRNFELNEGQKMKVIENFDRAGNTREVKLVFTTLAESFKRPATKKRVVKESYASKPVATTAPKKETTQVLSEGFELANRWKKLAGLL